MKQVTVTVVDPVGLHARPATVAVNAASKFKSEINVAFKGREVNMKSIMGVMSLGIPTQSEITISCSGEDEDGLTGLELLLLDFMMNECSKCCVSVRETSEKG